jgi:transposase InsO family protein
MSTANCCTTTRPCARRAAAATAIDNAQAESLWSRLKTEVLEVLERPVFANLADAQASVVEYFDYYNHERLHSSIDY